MLLGLIAEEMNDPHTMLAEDVEAYEHELHINGCYDYVDDEDDDEECYEIDEDYVEDADEDMEGDKPEKFGRRRQLYRFLQKV